MKFPHFSKYCPSEVYFENNLDKQFIWEASVEFKYLNQ